MRLIRWLRREIAHILPVFLFFLVTFSLINLTERFLFERAGLIPFSFTEVAVAAGVIAKVFLVIDHLPFVDLCSRKPLIYKIVWKTILYWWIVILVRMSVRFIPYLFGGDGWDGDVRAFIDHLDWRLFISVQSYYLMLLVIFVTSRELTSAIGEKKMKHIFFG